MRRQLVRAALVAALVVAGVAVPPLSAAAARPEPCAAVPTVPSKGVGELANAFATLNSFVTLTVPVDDPTATVVWCYNTASGATELARGNGARVRITDDRRATSYFAMVVDSAGEMRRSAPAAMAAVRPPADLVSAPSTGWIGDDVLELAASASGGYGDRARAIAFWQFSRSPGVWQDYTQSSTRFEGDNSVSTVRLPPFVLGEGDVSLRVVWHVCVVDSTSCLAQIPGTETVDPGVTTLRALVAPVVRNGLPPITYTAPGDRVVLSVRMDDDIPVDEYLWEVQYPGSSWQPASPCRAAEQPASCSGAQYVIQRASQVDHGVRYRVRPSNEAGPGPISETQIFLNHLAFETGETEGYSDVTVVNLLASPTTGSMPLTMVGNSGAWEIPKGTAQLETGMAMTSGWHWSSTNLDEWFDLSIGNTGWFVRVWHTRWDVRCLFAHDQASFPTIGDPIGLIDVQRESDTAPFACRAPDGADQLPLGIDESEQTLRIVNRAPVTVAPEAASALAAWACASPFASCAFSGTSTPVEVKISQQPRAASNCTPGQQVRTADLSLARESTTSLNLSYTFSMQVELKFGATSGGADPNPLALHVYLKTEYRTDQGHTVGTGRTDSYAARLTLLQHQVGFMAVYAPAREFNGDVVVALGDATYRLDDQRFVSTDPIAIGTGERFGVQDPDHPSTDSSSDVVPTYPVRTAFYVRPMTDDELKRYCG